VKKIFSDSFKRLNQQAWYIRLVHKEFWHSNIFFAPLAIYIAYLAARARSPFFFTAANPAIPTGGLVGESKADINRWIPPQYRPKNCLISAAQDWDTIQENITAAGISFPFILKPVVGARGLMVQKVVHWAEVAAHLNAYPTEFLVEEFIDYPIEAAVLYWKNPETGASGIQSVTLKKFLTVVGKNNASVRDLLMEQPRGILQIPRLMREKPDLMKSIPAAGTAVVVEPIGNHCRGTTFLNYNALITPDMVAAFDKIQADLPNCYVFRLDLKTPSVSELQKGQNIRILEINGVGADPAHIFDPQFSLWGMWHAYFRLWRTIYEVGTAAHRLGTPYMSWQAFKIYARKQKEMKRLGVEC
jgi:hypothetical protein